ncbi:MAG: diacylglycerol kinase family lipid kinase [Thermoflexales bacterium]|nr:diacylglycerol kinase family lipid kinase [Thermoflexales bacterium]
MDSLGQKVFVVLNPMAGQANPAVIRSALARYFAAPAWSCEIYETTGKEDVAQVVRQACEHGTGMVVAAGGDGTVAEVVNGLRHSRVPLGILPVGTGNVLAHGLFLPLELEPALKLLAGDHVLMAVDALQVGSRYFLLNVSVGITSQTVREMRPGQKRLWGIMAYVWTGTKHWIGFQPCRFALMVDGRQRRIRASEILVSNGTLLKEPPLPIGPPETFSDGQLDVYIVTARTMYDYIKVAWNLVFNPRNRKIRLRRLTARQSITIDAGSRVLPVQADGDVIGETPVEIRLVPAAVRVVAPKPI